MVLLCYYEVYHTAADKVVALLNTMEQRTLYCLVPALVYSLLHRPSHLLHWRQRKSINLDEILVVAYRGDSGKKFHESLVCKIAG